MCYPIDRLICFRRFVIFGQIFIHDFFMHCNFLVVFFMISHLFWAAFNVVIINLPNKSLIVINSELFKKTFSNLVDIANHHGREENFTERNCHCVHCSHNLKKWRSKHVCLRFHLHMVQISGTKYLLHNCRSYTTHCSFHWIVWWLKSKYYTLNGKQRFLLSSQSEERIGHPFFQFKMTTKTLADQISRKGPVKDCSWQRYINSFRIKRQIFL